MAAALFMSSCAKEDNIPEVSEGPETMAALTIPYTVTVSGEPETRVTVDGDMKTLRFAEGDKLYIAGLYIKGVLDIRTGIGETSATFSGNLTYSGTGAIPDNYPLIASLVSAQQTVGKEMSVDEYGIVNVNYPHDEYCKSVDEAVRRYSRLSCVSTYSNKSFTLSPDTSFLNFEICFEDGTPAGIEISAVVSNENKPICTANIATIGEDRKVVARFVLPLPAYLVLRNASLKLGTRDLIPLFSDTPGAAVKNVKRTVIYPRALTEMPLTMEALTAGTVKVNIDGTLSSGMKYAVNGGEKTLVTTSTDIPVSMGDKVQFYGNGTATQVYGGTPGVKIQGGGSGFTCKAYGNVMSLLDEEGFVTKTDLPGENFIFRELFKDNSALTDASDLLLPATTLAQGCYLSMFQGCTALRAAPNLPATTLVHACYYSMFSNCANLNSVRCFATSGINENDSTSEWLSGVAATGTFYLAGGTGAKWSQGVNGIPGGWTMKFPDGSTITDFPLVDLSTIYSNYTAFDGQSLTGTPAGLYKITIADGATVTLAGVTINGKNDTSHMWAGINCEGDATIILKDGTTNIVKGFHEDYPGIHMPPGKTLTIKGESEGTGSLIASAHDFGAGIGGGNGISCGNIVILGGIITATGSAYSTGIGSGKSNKDKISRCGNIDILGGTVTATGGFLAAGIGSGLGGRCGNITIAKTVISVTATKGSGAPYSIGASQDGTCGTVTIEPGANVTQN